VGRSESCGYAVIERVAGEWRQRLRTCVRAKEGHFEHMLYKDDVM